MFKDAVIIITGGSSGLGKALAHRLIKMGATVVLIARDKNKLATTRDELSVLCGAGGRTVETFSCNVADYIETEKTMKNIATLVGCPDILINCAGVLKEGYFEKLSLSTFREVMDINFFGVLNCTKAALPLFKRKGKGRIVNIASLGGKIGSFGYSAYCSSKFALVGLTEILRTELKPQNIKLHLVCPGEFESPMVDELNTYRTIENRVLTHAVPVLPLNVVADKVIKGIQEDRYLIIPGFIAGFIERLSRLFPLVSRVYHGPQ